MQLMAQAMGTGRRHTIRPLRGERNSVWTNLPTVTSRRCPSSVSQLFHSTFPENHRELTTDMSFHERLLPPVTCLDSPRPSDPQAQRAATKPPSETHSRVRLSASPSSRCFWCHSGQVHPFDLIHHRLDAGAGIHASVHIRMPASISMHHQHLGVGIRLFHHIWQMMTIIA